MSERRNKKPRKPGAWRGWGANIPIEVLLAPMDPEDLDAAEGLDSDEWGITLADKRSKRKKPE